MVVGMGGARWAETEREDLVHMGVACYDVQRHRGLDVDIRV